MLNNQVFTTKEAAQYLRINKQVLERYLREGIVPARKLGRQWRVSKLALDLWIAPSLGQVLPRMFLWQEIFNLGDQISKKVSLTDEKILYTLSKIRKERGITLKSRS